MKVMVEMITKSERETKEIARLLAEEIFGSLILKNRAWVIGLQGELGSGKTRFIQGFAKGLGIKRRLTSPTFVLLKKYKIPKKRATSCLYHIDCYRLNKPKELLDLDFKEIISDPQSIIVIEWAEKVKKILPKDIIWIKFQVIDKNKRKIKIL